jgi:hypothetical protein
MSFPDFFLLRASHNIFLWLADEEHPRGCTPHPPFRHPLPRGVRELFFMPVVIRQLPDVTWHLFTPIDSQFTPRHFMSGLRTG